MEGPQMGQLVNFLFTVHELKWELAPNSHILPSPDRWREYHLVSIWRTKVRKQSEKIMCVEEVFSQCSLGTEQLHSEGDLFYFGTDIYQREVTFLFRSVFFVSDVNMDEPL